MGVELALDLSAGGTARHWEKLMLIQHPSPAAILPHTQLILQLFRQLNEMVPFPSSSCAHC